MPDRRVKGAVLRSFCAAGLIIGALASCGIARDALYSPRPEPLTISAWTNETPQSRTVVTQDGLTLTGYFWPGEEEDKDIFVFFHGRHAHQGIGAKYAQYLRGRGDAVLVASFRGFGGNPGKPTMNGLQQDAAAFIGHARSLVGEGSRVWLVGHSLGASVAINAAAADGHVAGVITIGAFAKIEDATPPLLRGFIVDRWDNVTPLAKVDEPVVFLHGLNDKVVPPSSAPRLLKAATGPAVAISLKDHAHKPNMQAIGPWISAAIATMAQGQTDSLPPLPDNWVTIGQHP